MITANFIQFLYRDFLADLFVALGGGDYVDLD